MSCLVYKLLALTKVSVRKSNDASARLGALERNRVHRHARAACATIVRVHTRRACIQADILRVLWRQRMQQGYLFVDTPEWNTEGAKRLLSKRNGAEHSVENDRC